MQAQIENVLGILLGLISSQKAYWRKWAGGRFLPSGYKRLSAHYAWALAQIFDVSGHAAGRRVGLKVLGRSFQLLVAWACCWVHMLWET